ncbi:MAG TPA: HAD-IB family phosphatase [Syntrophorhabdaceae bacterium]|nr:HAD-IB family phosphatase [Syntrophorhabdaceae bacterium]HQM81564.1 HAD-IB family phosphatase [Syntrophorhabdaceae bacterium]
MSIKIVFFDCDGTLTKEKSSWEFLHRRLGLWNNRADMYQRLFKEGAIDYHEFCKRDALLWRGMPVADVARVVREIPYQDGAWESIRSIKDMGITTFIVSTGLSVLVDLVKSELSIDGAVSNELLSKDGVLTGEVKINVEYDKKGSLVGTLLGQKGFVKKDACAVGDGEGDVAMFEAVGLPIGFNPNERVLPHIKHACCGCSLVGIVDILRGCGCVHS